MTVRTSCWREPADFMNQLTWRNSWKYVPFYNTYQFTTQTGWWREPVYDTNRLVMRTNLWHEPIPNTTQFTIWDSLRYETAWWQEPVYDMNQLLTRTDLWHEPVVDETYCLDTEANHWETERCGTFGGRKICLRNDRGMSHILSFIYFLLVSDDVMNVCWVLRALKHTHIDTHTHMYTQSLAVIYKKTQNCEVFR